MEELREIKFFQWYYRNAAKVFHPIFGVKKQKEFFEVLYWRIQKIKEGKLTNHHYEYFFTKYFGFSSADYNGKRVLDIGCGPRGSLEWARGAELRIGLDTLADKYTSLEGKNHSMQYVNAAAESIPFDSNYFDVISSFNSLDHVDDLSLSIQEIKRVLKPRGYFLLITDIHEDKTLCEPSNFSWDIVNQFAPEFILLEEKHFEGNLMYKSIRSGVAYDHQNQKKRYGILTAKFIKNN